MVRIQRLSLAFLIARCFKIERIGTQITGGISPDLKRNKANSEQKLEVDEPGGP